MKFYGQVIIAMESRIEVAYRRPLMPEAKMQNVYIQTLFGLDRNLDALEVLSMCVLGDRW